MRSPLKIALGALLVVALAPAAGLAGGGLDASPLNRTMRIGGSMSRISASTPRSRISFDGTTCYSEPEAAHDILRKQYFGKTEGPSFSVIAIDVYGKNPGTCTFTFGAGGEKATVHVTVTK